MKINWGTGIVIGMIAFMSVIVYFVAQTFSLTPELVHDNYYDREVSYQSEVINPRKKAQELALEVNFKEEDGLMFFQLNKGLYCDSIKMEMIHIAHKSSDFNKTFVQSNPELIFKSSSFDKGRYNCAINYYFNGAHALIEKTIELQ